MIVHFAQLRKTAQARWQQTTYCVEKLNSWRLSSRREKIDLPESRVCHDRALGKGSSTPCHGSETVNLEFFNTIDPNRTDANVGAGGG